MSTAHQESWCGNAAHCSLLCLLQICEVLNATEMTCQAPALALGPDHQSDLTERPEEFGFILDNVQSLLILNKTNFTYYPNPVFEAFSPSGILELKPGTPIILKVFQISFSWHFSYQLLIPYWEDERTLVYVMY